MDQGAIYSFMARFRYGVVSSVSKKGVPESALVGIAITPDLEIIFDAARTSRKYANLTERPSCAFVVGWDCEQTVQFEGVASEPTGEELKRCQEAYFSVWKDGRDRMDWPGIAYFVVRPKWIRYSDYDAAPPLVVEMTMAKR